MATSSDESEEVNRYVARNKTKQKQTKTPNTFNCICNDLVSRYRKLTLLLWICVYHSRDGALNVVVNAPLREMIENHYSPSSLVGLCEEQVKDAVKAQENISSRDTTAS